MGHGGRFKFHRGAADHAYMRQAPLPQDDGKVVVEIWCQTGQDAHQRLAEGINESPAISTVHTNSSSGDDSDNDFIVGLRNFGAALSFRYMSDVQKEQ
jgi:diacylglycerol kinase (ATP)